MSLEAPARAEPRPSIATDEAALWSAFRAARAPELRDKLFSTYAAFARGVARRHFRDRRSGDIEFADLSQLACAGLLEAIDRYDPDVGVPFKRFAGRRISGSIVDGVTKMSEVRQQVSFRNRVRRERARSLTDPDAANLPATDALQALIDVAVGLALGFMLDGAGLYVADADERDAGANAYESLAWKETVQRILSEIAALPERERTLMRRHYLDGLTFEQIGELMEVTKGRVSQIHKATIGLLRKRVLGAPGFRLQR